MSFFFGLDYMNYDTLVYEPKSLIPFLSLKTWYRHVLVTMKDVERAVGMLENLVTDKVATENNKG